MGAGLGGTPVPWWTTSGVSNSGQAERSAFEANTPAGYRYDPVKRGYVRTATAQGQDVSDYLKAAGFNFPSFTSLFGAGGEGGGGAGGGTVPRVAPIPDDTDAAAGARNAAFARAKDTAGNIARSALDSLHSEASGRGLNVAGGSNPLMLRGEADILGATGNQLGEVSREQAIQDAARASAVADRNYQGNIAMRGQDITQRGQDISAQEAALQRMQSLYSLFFGSIPQFNLNATLY